jgi:hypothetical protein
MANLHSSEPPPASLISCAPISLTNRRCLNTYLDLPWKCQRIVYGLKSIRRKEQVFFFFFFFLLAETLLLTWESLTSLAKIRCNSKRNKWRSRPFLIRGFGSQTCVQQFKNTQIINTNQIFKTD